MIRWLRIVQGGAARCAATVVVVCLIPSSGRGEEVGRSGLAWDLFTPRADLTPAEARRTPEHCAGAYRWPRFPHPRNILTDEFPVEAEARRVQYWESGEVILEGDVVVNQGNRTLRAPAVRLNHETRMGSVTERVQIEEPDIILRGSAAEMNLDTKASTITGAEFLLPEGEFRGTARELNRDDDGNLRVNRGSFTRCEPGNNNWRISSRSFDIKDDSDFGTARDAVVRVKNVPVLYTPFISFPINDERKSGWLFPNVGYSSQNGFEFSPPYYLNLAPNYDATIMPRYFQKRGLGIEAEFRHLSRWQQTTLVGSFLGDDKQYDGIYEKDDFRRLEEAGLVEGPFVPADRWLYAMYHKGDFRNWRTTVDYTAVSDRDYFRNLGTELDVAARRELERRGEIQYLRGGLDVRLWAQRFDRLDEVTVDPYQRLPELAVNYVGRLPGPFEWGVGASGVSFDRNNDDLTGTNRIVGHRVHAEPRLSMPLMRSWGFLTLTGGYRYTAYDLRDTAPDVDDTPERKIGFGIVDSGLFFERDTTFFGGAAVHTLEPRVRYLYQQFRDQSGLPRFDASRLTFRYDQLWRDNRFSGIDRVGDANQLSVGLTSRMLSAANGREYLRASIGQIRYFEDRRVTLSGSPQASDLSSGSEVAGELVGSLSPRWRIGGNVVWDPNEEQINEGGGFVRFKRDNDHILHLGYRYQRPSEVDQTDVAFMWGISKRYTLIGRWNYDLNTKRTIEGLAGIEYNDCCWQIRLIARRYLDTPSAREFEEAKTRNGAFLQIVFKGLAGLGNSVESLLSRSIQGYSMESYGNEI